MAAVMGHRPARHVVCNHVVLVGSGLVLSGDSASRAGPATVRVGAGDSGTTVRLSTADKLEVTLEGNPTTGYT